MLSVIRQKKVCGVVLHFGPLRNKALYLGGGGGGIEVLCGTAAKGGEDSHVKRTAVLVVPYV